MAVTWASITDVAEAFSPSGEVPDDAHFARCVAAANSFVYRRRQASGYTAADGGPEDETTVPGPDVALAVITAGVILFRQRGALNAFPSFEELGQYNPPGVGWGEVYRMAGLNKPRVF